MTATAELRMPFGYVEVNDEEMEYLDGGAVKTSWAAAFFDVIGMAMCPYFAPLKIMGRQAAANLVSRNLWRLAPAAAKIARSVLGLSINATAGKIGKAIFGYGWYFTSVGGVIAISLDIADGKIDGWIGQH